MRIIVFCLIATLASVGLTRTALAAEQGDNNGAAAPPDRAWVKKKVQTCAACHGPKGVSTQGQFPVLAGQYKNYLVHALSAYRDGDRQNGIMNGQANGLTDAQIDALAAYFSSQKSPLHTPSLEKP